MLLDFDTMKEMVKPVGPRMKLLANLKKLKADSDEVSTDVSCGESSSDVSDKFPCSPGSSTSECNFAISAPPRKKFKSDFNIRALLKEHSAIGESIIDSIEKGELTRKERLKFVRIVVAHLIQHCGDRPACEVKARLAKAIVDEFPSLKDSEGEGFEAWYTRGKGKHSSSGWIEERLRNVRRSYSTGKANSPTANSSSTLTAAILPESDLSHEQFQSMVEWLKHNVAPSSQVISFMEKTAVKRAEWIRKNPGQPFNKIVMEYPRLFDTPGMIEADFRMLFPDVSDSLYLLWTPAYICEVIKYASLQGNWESHLNINASRLCTDENKSNVALGLLPCILPPGKKGKKRASIAESLASYIDVKPIVTNMPKYLEEVTNEQPYILVLGSLLEPSQYFVIVERQALQQTSLLKAVDVCFKVFYILDIKYPWQCYTTWEFFQKVVFGLEDAGGNTKTSPAVIAMRTALQKQ